MCYSMLTILPVICEAEPNSVFSSSDIEAKEVLTNRGKKKKMAPFFWQANVGPSLFQKARWLPVTNPSLLTTHQHCYGTVPLVTGVRRRLSLLGSCQSGTDVFRQVTAAL